MCAMHFAKHTSDSAVSTQSSGLAALTGMLRSKMAEPLPTTAIYYTASDAFLHNELYAECIHGGELARNVHCMH